MSKKDLWISITCISILLTIISFVNMANCKDGSDQAKIAVVFFLFAMLFTVFCVGMANVYNAKEKKMDAPDYLKDRFSNAIPETKELLGRGKGRGGSPSGDMHYGSHSSDKAYWDGYHGFYDSDIDNDSYRESFERGMMDSEFDDGYEE